MKHWYKIIWDLSSSAITYDSMNQISCETEHTSTYTQLKLRMGN